MWRLARAATSRLQQARRLSMSAISGPCIVHKRGTDILHDPWFNKDTGFPLTERDRLGLRGLLPPRVISFEQQYERFMNSYRSLEHNTRGEPGAVVSLAKWRILNRLHDRNETLYYRVLIDNIKDFAPIIYTPTVGLVCQNYGGLFRRPRGMYFSARDKGEMMSMIYNWPSHQVDMIVVTDGSRILGLGDLGVQGIGIPIGKLDMYVAAAGINPQRILPVMLDVGTNNQKLLEDDLYLGLRQPRLEGDEYLSIVDEFMEAASARWPKAVIQFEDFQMKWAFETLHRYRKRFCMFNDDIQGTAGVALAGLLGAVRAQGRPLKDLAKQKIVVVGAGSAGIGVLNMVKKAVSRMVGSGGLRLDSLCTVSPLSSPSSAKESSYCDHQRLSADVAASTDITADAAVSRQPFIIGVCGGTASGKTTVCDMIIQQLQDHRVVLVNQDSFYRGLTAEESKHAEDYNFDHPDAFDTEQLLKCMGKLKSGQSVNVPIYDFKNHRRCSESFRKVNASDVIILEGILVFHDPQVRNLMDMKIFVDTDDDIRLARRIRRDTIERGRDVCSVLDQYGRFVKTSFDDFVLPSKKYADVIIPRGGDNFVAINLIVQHIRTKLGQHELCKIYPNVYVIQSTFQIRGMHTLIRDQDITTPDFVFYSDRLIRLVVEHGLGHLPFTEKQVVTPTGSIYMGVDFCKKLCGVSIIRSGESMENALRACCKGIKLGKILIHRVGDNGEQLIYEKLPHDISERHVLLLDPVLATGNSANQAIELLIQKGVPESHIIFLNLISAPEGIHRVCKKFPSLKIVTSEIDVALNEGFQVIPGLGEFGDRYLGTVI